MEIPVGHIYSDEYGEYSIRDIVNMLVNTPIEEVPLSVLLHNLKFKCWDHDSRIISPNDVMNTSRDKFLEHWRRIEDCDLSYPIIIMDENNVIDGMHRLSKLYLLGADVVECKRINREDIEKCKIIND